MNYEAPIISHELQHDIISCLLEQHHPQGTKTSDEAIEEKNSKNAVSIAAKHLHELWLERDLITGKDQSLDTEELLGMRHRIALAALDAQMKLNELEIHKARLVEVLNAAAVVISTRRPPTLLGPAVPGVPTAPLETSSLSPQLPQILSAAPSLKRRTVRDLSGLCLACGNIPEADNIAACAQKECRRVFCKTCLVSCRIHDAADQHMPYSEENKMCCVCVYQKLLRKDRTCKEWHFSFNTNEGEVLS